ncbi:MAG: methyl-accepting chemotaxis protein [Calditrichaeota bacterium]|nr:MAG: methyl-accepting chemotaxis protein [Calditrichota bacterium]
MVENLSHSARKMDAIAGGDLDNPILKIEKNREDRADKVLGSSVDTTVKVLYAILSEIDVLISAAKAGDLSVRAKEENYEGTYRQLCEGINAMLQAFEIPIRSISHILNNVASNDLTVHVAGRFEGSFEALQADVNKTINRLRSSIANIAGNARNLAASSEEFATISDAMATNAVRTADQSNTVSVASGRISENVKYVANGTSEMNHAIKEISVSAQEAARIAADAAQYAAAASKTITKLDESSHEIEQVVKIISNIAAQTRLLALNATIESARAGAAGSGFAVVANEVKVLADQTTGATEKIRERIQAIQHESSDTVTVIRDISDVIANVNKLSVQIASAVEEQSVATSTILENVNDAASGVDEITANISGVAQAAESTSTGANDSKSTSQELARMATELQTLVEQFSY